MIDIFGEDYYINFETLDEFLISDSSFEAGENESIEISEQFDAKGNLIGSSTSTMTSDKVKEINGVRYDIIRSFISDLTMEAENEDYDYTLGSNNLQKTSIRFKLAYNTLTKYGILTKNR